MTKRGLSREDAETAQRALRAYELEIVTIEEAIADGSVTPPMRDRLAELELKSDQLYALLMRENARLTRNEQSRMSERWKLQVVADGVATCEGCAWQIPERFVSRIMHVHHVTPVSWGGDNNPSNLVVICPNCHAIAHEILATRNLDNPLTRQELLAILKADPLAALQVVGNRRK